jgi:hypothetical protein
MINFMLAANMIEQNQTRQKLVAILKNALKKIVQEQIAVKMVNAPCRHVKMRVVAKMANVI